MFTSLGGVGLRSPRLSRSMFWLGLLTIVIGYLLTTEDLYRYANWQSRGFFSGSSAGFNTSSAQASSSLPFNYKAVVAYQAKDRSDGIYANIKNDSPTGEDNYFIAMKNSSDLYAGVADGVGGWAEHGYDSSAISREICSCMKDFVFTSCAGKSTPFTPKHLIDWGYTKVKKDEIVKVGGTTAIVAHFAPNGSLSVANLGDSWCGVFRESRLVFQTKFQTVGFNAPYQLAIIPDSMLKEAARRGGSYIQNKPNDADEYNFKLKQNDIVVLATDGVTDNIAVEDMELFLKDHGDDANLQDTCQTFVDQVVKLSKDPTFPSVFAQEISKLSGKQYSGGKEDDITVVIVKVE